MQRSTCFYTVFLGFILFLTGFNPVAAQDKWALSVNRDGIQVYTRPIDNSKIKAIRVVGTMSATPTQLLAAILDIQTCDEWVYHSTENIMLKQLSPLDLIYYSRIDVPWPVEDRDYVVHIQTEQNPDTKVITVSSPCVPGYVPEKKNIVRISHSVGKWTITPIGKNQVKAEYVLEVDPMGSIPAWLINLFATKGPLETFRGLKVHVQKEVYKKARFKQIVD
ncbi:START domain-containing protein [Pedobacter sp. PAMC26386]|nr:START domain-containing protein [Pedobacter sp. PAMC26386]